MSSLTDHIILRQSVEISFQDLDDAFGVQEQIADLFYERVQPGMQKLFDELFASDEMASIERLELDCGLLSKKNWESEWVENTLQQLKEQLRQVHIKKRQVTDISDSFLFYLEHGSLPWNSRHGSISEIEEILIVDTSLISRVRELINEKPLAAKRLAYRFSGDIRQQVIKLLSAFTGSPRSVQIKKMVGDFKKTGMQQEVIDEAMLMALSSNDSSEEVVRNLFTSTHPSLPIEHERKEKQVKLHATSKKDNDKVMYINNAGLIILHPFLPEFFEQLGLYKQGEWTDEQAQQRASLVLDYLVNGQDRIEEPGLSLAKILCGMLPETVITEKELPAKKIKSACEELLQAVIHHWPALKNTGIESFRYTFLQRRGKLSLVDDGWLLQVERQGVDILLSDLPWGIGTIKLPWMSQILYTEW